MLALIPILTRGTGDGHVLALDATNGAVLWDITIADPKKGESIPMAPIAWSGSCSSATQVVTTSV